ncbi:MAG: hypothetical protein NWQ47_06765, partial [Crocinitomicaceae bacterium]|nr:hypothetical protein [Crocinitomicaceae bacterium]
MKILQLTTFLFFLTQLNAQNSDKPSWTADYSKSKSFIENLGQFDEHENSTTGKIRYAADFGSTRIFFGDKGLTYSFLEIKKKTRDERQAIINEPAKSFEDHKQKERLAGKYLLKADEINMSWVNCNSSAVIQGIGKSDDYHSYSFNNKGEHKSVNLIPGFEKIIYKNIYPKIDVEYTIHPVIGVKYAFIIHPGADVSDIKMNFDRDLKLLNNELIIPTLFGDIIDHSPVSFYQNEETNIIESFYRKDGNAVSFEVAKFDQTKTLVIDPWVQTPVFPDNWDCVWELDTDAAGNVYIIGGIMPMQLKKYNSAGTLQWTHNTPYDTTAWLGTMATDDIGNTYITNGTYYAIQKVDNLGNVVWNNGNPAGGQLSTEFWNITFNCDQTKLIVGGTGGNLDLHGRIYDVNMANGNITSSVQVTQSGNLFAIPPQIQEVRAMCAAPNGKYYFATLDTIGYMNDNLTLCPSGSSSLLETNHGVNWGYKSENWRYNNTGIKVIRADANFVYVHKGNALQKRSLADFSLIASVTIPGGVLSTPFLSDNITENAGIDIDNCGNIYVGSKTGVYKFNSNLVQQGFYATSFFVYDVRVSSAGEVVACGGTGNSNSATRSGGVQSFAASACAPIAITCCDATICLPNELCQSDAPIILTPATPGGIWSGPGVNASGIFSPSTAGAGTHSITYTLPCGSETISVIVNPCTALSVCVETNGTLTVSNGTPTYTWSNSSTVSTPITNQATCVACGGTATMIGPIYISCSVGTNCVSTVWTSFGTGTNQTVSTYPVQIVDGIGTTLVINSVSGLPACSSVPCPSITLSTSSQTNVACFGNSTGAATVSASGGASAYTYTWVPGNLNGASQSNLAAGTYTVNIVDANSCPGSGTVTITQPAAALSVSMANTAATCGSNNGTATA